MKGAEKMAVLNRLRRCLLIMRNDNEKGIVETLY